MAENLPGEPLEQPLDTFDDSGVDEVEDWEGADQGVGHAVDHNVAPVPSSVAKEIAAIESRMRTDRAGYFKDEQMQSRYRALIEASHGLRPNIPTASAPLTVEEERAVAAFQELPPEEQEGHLSFWNSGVGQNIINKWNRMGGVMKNAQAADALVADLKSELPFFEDFESLVSSLPIPVQIAMSVELAFPHVGGDAFANQAEVGAFASKVEGAELVREWGGQANRNVGIVRARLRRIVERLAPGHQQSFGNFIDQVTADEFKIIARFLVR